MSWEENQDGLVLGKSSEEGILRVGDDPLFQRLNRLFPYVPDYMLCISKHIDNFIIQSAVIHINSSSLF